MTDVCVEIDAVNNPPAPTPEIEQIEQIEQKMYDSLTEKLGSIIDEKLAGQSPAGDPPQPQPQPQPQTDPQPQPQPQTIDNNI